MSGYVKTLKIMKRMIKIKNDDKNNKLMSFYIDDEKLLEKYKTIWAKIEDFIYIDLNALPVYDDRSIKTKKRTYGDKVYSNFRGLNVPEDDIECEYFTIISIDSLLVYGNKYCLQVYLGNCAYKTSE